MAAPIIETERLTLRGHRVTDHAALIAMWSDPAVTRFISGVPPTPQQTWQRLLGYVGHWELLGFGYWALEERTSGALIGELGFADYRRGIPELQGVPEIGWALSPAASGKGYATEAVRSVVAWGDVHFEGAPTRCLISPENAASIRVAQKCGYIEASRIVFNQKPVLVFERVSGRDA